MKYYKIKNLKKVNAFTKYFQKPKFIDNTLLTNLCDLLKKEDNQNKEDYNIFNIKK